MESNKLIEAINNKWIDAGKKAKFILQLMENESLPCTFHEAMELAIRVNFNDIDFNIFFNNYKEICK